MIHSEPSAAWVDLPILRHKSWLTTNGYIQPRIHSTMYSWHRSLLSAIKNSGNFLYPILDYSNIGKLDKNITQSGSHSKESRYVSDTFSLSNL